MVQWTYDFPLSQVSDDDNSMRNCIVAIVKVVVVDVVVIVGVGVDGDEEGSQPTVIHIVVDSNWWFLILNEQWITWIEIEKISLWMNKMNKIQQTSQTFYSILNDVLWSTWSYLILLMKYFSFKSIMMTNHWWHYNYDQLE